jgi:hypothetical protein
MDTSYLKEQPKNQEYVATRKEVKEEDSATRKWELIVRHNGMHKHSVPLYSVYIL